MQRKIKDNISNIPIIMVFHDKYSCLSIAIYFKDLLLIYQRATNFKVFFKTSMLFGQYCNIFSVGLLDFPWGTNFIVKIEISTSSASFLPFPWRLKWMTDAE